MGSAGEVPLSGFDTAIRERAPSVPKSFEARKKTAESNGVIGSGRVLLPGGGANKDTPRPPPRESEKLGGGLDPPQGK